MAGKHYSLEVKTKAIRMAVELGMTHGAVEEVLGIRDRSRIKKWMRAYRREGLAPFTKPRDVHQRSKVSWNGCGWKMHS